MSSILLLLVVALLATTGFSEASTEASEESRQDCPSTSLRACHLHKMPREFPGTLIELDDACKLALRHMECVIAYEDLCGDVYLLPELRKYLKIYERICNNTSPLFNAVATNLNCIKSQIHGTMCNSHNERELLHFIKLLQDQEINITATEWFKPIHCTEELLYYGCIPARVGNKCGNAARDAVTEIFLMEMLPSVICSNKTLNEFPTIVKILQEDLFRRKKRKKNKIISKAYSDCVETVSDACRDSMRLEFPATEEELDASCEEIRQYLACVKEHEENCEGNPDTLQEMSKFASFIQRACDKDSNIYSVLVDNLVCVRKEVLVDKCSLDFGSEEEMAKFAKRLQDQGITSIAKEDSNIMLCTSQIYLLACKAVRIGTECGETAKDAMNEIFQNFMYPLNICSEKIITELPNIVRLLEVSDEK